MAVGLRAAYLATLKGWLDKKILVTQKIEVKSIVDYVDMVLLENYEIRLHRAQQKSTEILK